MVDDLWLPLCDSSSTIIQYGYPIVLTFGVVLKQNYFQQVDYVRVDDLWLPLCDSSSTIIQYGYPIVLAVDVGKHQTTLPFTHCFTYLRTDKKNIAKIKHYILYGKK